MHVSISVRPWDAPFQPHDLWTMTGVTSAAAVGTLQVPKAQWDKDVVLQLVSKLASPLQLTITHKKDPLSFTATGYQLTQRNAILRCLAGYGLLFAMDQSPYYLLGGHAMTARTGGATSAMALAGMVQWMSAADGVARTGASEELLTELEVLLTKQAYLVPSALPTLADWDLAVALVATQGLESYPSVSRWLSTVLAMLQDYGAKVGVKVPSGPAPLPAAPIAFYYGTEDMDAVLVPATKSTAPTKGKPAAKGKPQGKEQPKPQGGNEKKKKDKPKKPQPPPPAEVPLSVAALDIRVGQIKKAWHHEEADKLFCEEIDLGTETRNIASGLRPFYKTEDLTGRRVLVLCNLKKRNLVGFPSHGMVLCASNADHTKVEFVVPPEDTPIGERVVFDGIEMVDPEPENKVAKKKLFEKIAPDLKTDGRGQVVWKDSVAKTSKGVVQALNGMAGAQVS